MDEIIDQLAQKVADKVLAQMNSEISNIRSEIRSIKNENTYTASDVAEISGKHYSTILKHIRSGTLRTSESDVKGGKITITQSQLDEYLGN